MPNLAEFSQHERADYRRILVAVNKQLENAILNLTTARPNRGYPLGSWLSLPNAFPMSPAMSNAATVISENSKHASVTPRVPSGDSTPRQAPPLVQEQITEVQPVPEIMVPGSSDASPSPLSESISPPKLSVRKLLRASSPFHVTSGKLSLEFELEGPGQQDVAIEHASADTTNEYTIDVGNMVPGDPLHIERNKEKDRLVFTLRYGSNTSLQVAFQ